ncbi:MAG: DUF883 family protein [Casimicrobiaceae bacterium]
MANFPTNRDDMMDDVSTAVSDAQDMLQEANKATSERARELRAQVESKLRAAKLRLQELRGQAVEQTRAAAKATDEYVHQNPWQVLGVAAVVGVVVGLLLTRGGSSDD